MQPPHANADSLIRVGMVSLFVTCFQVWDIAMESRPVHTLPIHEHLRSKLVDLYENDCIFDKFEVAINGTGSYVTLCLRRSLRLPTTGLVCRLNRNCK